MLSNHLQNGIETAKLVWARLPSSEEGEVDELGVSKKSDGSSVESLDYEVIENHAYREEQSQRGKLYVGYYVVVKWFFALLIGIGECQPGACKWPCQADLEVRECGQVQALSESADHTYTNSGSLCS